MVKFIYNKSIDKSQFAAQNNDVGNKVRAIPYIVFSMDSKPVSFNPALAKAFAFCYKIIKKKG